MIICDWWYSLYTYNLFMNGFCIFSNIWEWWTLTGEKMSKRGFSWLYNHLLACWNSTSNCVWQIGSDDHKSMFWTEKHTKGFERLKEKKTCQCLMTRLMRVAARRKVAMNWPASFATWYHKEYMYNAVKRRNVKIHEKRVKLKKFKFSPFS